MHESTYREMKKFAETLPKTKLRIADVGSGDVNGTYRNIFERPDWQYVGLDISPGRNVDVVLSGENEWANVPSESFDVVISGQVLEHTRLPWLFVRELARIAKRGAPVCIIAPYQWEYHPFPIDCWRVFPDGMRAVMEWNGLRVLATYMNENPNGDGVVDPRYKGDTIGIGKKP